MLAALLVAGGAVAHAAWNLVLKATPAGGVRFLALTVVVSVAVLAPLGAAPLAATVVERPWLVAPLLLSGALHSGYFLLLQRAYRAADVSVVYPAARGTGPLLSVVAAVVVLGERPGALALVGAAVVVTGVVVTGVVVIGLAGARAPGAPRSGDAADARGRPRLARGVALGAAVGVVIAGYTLLDAVAVTRLGLEPVAWFWGSLVVQLLVLAAYELAPVAIVAPAREASVVLVALAGWLMLREPHPAQRLVGSAIVLAGVALLAVG